MRARWRWLELASVVGALMVGAGSHPAFAQPALTGVVLSGGASASTRLALGSRIASPSKSWTEIAFSDGSSIVLGPGAQLTVQLLAFDPKTGRSRIVAVGGGGQIRVETANDTEADLSLAGAVVRVISAAAVLQAVPHGSVSMLGGREVVVAQTSRQDTLRRPGFSVALDGSGPRRDSEQELVAQSTPFSSPRAPGSPSPEPARVPSQPTRRTPPVSAVLATARIATSRGAVAIAPSVDALSTGLTGQSGSFTFTPAAASGLTSGPTTAIPDLSFSGFLATPFASAPSPTAAGTAPPPEAAPVTIPQPPFVTVDGNFLAGIPGTKSPITVPGTGATVSAGLVPSNEHLKWGFFIPVGSSTPSALVLSSSDILTFQVSGPGVPTGTLQTLTGSATYVGGLIGNVLGANGVVRETGQFAQIWNFGTRSGSLNANFDGSSWLGIGLTMPAGTNVYAGSGVSKTDQRSLSLQGGFYNSVPVTPGAFPGATGGSFSIKAPGLGVSSAGGIFVGTRR